LLKIYADSLSNDRDPIFAVNQRIFIYIRQHAQTAARIYFYRKCIARIYSCSFSVSIRSY